jgi:hypothetical protein
VPLFIDAVPPEKVEYIFASLHVVERDRIYGDSDSFIESVAMLQDRGYRIEVNYVMYPPLFDRVDRDYRACLERGVRLTLKRFAGRYENRSYPASYTKEQNAVIAGYSASRGETEGETRHFNGRRCNAGKNLVRIKSNGDVVRCPADHSLLGNVFSGFRLYEAARPCLVHVCPCFAEDRLFDDVETGPAASVRMPLAARARHFRNKLKGFWEQD